jgi:hypothetical protein
VLGGEPYMAGPAKLDEGWGRRELDRTAWRVAIGDNALAKEASPSAGAALGLTEFEKAGMRRIPKTFSASGHFWDFSLTCSQPKLETDPDLPPSDDP